MRSRTSDLGCVYIYIYINIYMVRHARPSFAFFAHERLTKNDPFIPTLLSSWYEISLGTRLGGRCVYMCIYLSPEFWS